MKYIVEYDTFRQMNSLSINEGLAQGLMTDVVQFLLSGAAEYGLSAATIGTGTPAALAIETVIDASFAGKVISDAIKQIDEMKGKLDKFTEMVNNCMKSIETFRKGQLKEFYEQVRQIITDGLSIMKGAEDTVDKLAEKLRGIIADLMRKLTDAVAKGLKLLIPDATIGASVSIGIKGVVESISQNGYTIASGLVDKSGDLKKYLIDPEALPNLIKQTLPEFYKMCEGYKEKIKEMGWIKAITFFAGKIEAAIILKKLGPTGLDQLIKMVKTSEPKVLDLIEKILRTVVPVTFTLLAIYEILMKGEYKKKEEQENNKDTSDKKEKDASKKDKEPQGQKNKEQD